MSTKPRASTTAEQRIGLMVPSSNTSIEVEFAHSLPRDITIHSARLPLFDSVEPEAIEMMSRDIENASRLLATASVDLLFVGATVPSLLKGFGHAEAFVFACTNWRLLPAIERIEAEFGKAVVTSNQASLYEALCALDRPAHLPGCGRLLNGGVRP